MAKGGIDKGNLKLMERVNWPDKAQKMKFPMPLALI